MNQRPQQFSIDITELLSITPTHPFNKDDVEVVNFLKLQKRDPQEVVLLCVEAAINRDYDSLKKFSFYNNHNTENLLSLASKVNKLNCNQLVKIATYAFNSDISIELNTMLIPVDDENIYKLQAAQLKCVENVSCTIIIPSTVDKNELLFYFLSANEIVDNNEDFSIGNVFQHYIKNTSLNNLLNLPEATYLKKNNLENIHLFNIFKVEYDDVDGIANILKYIKNYKLYIGKTILEIAYEINPDLINENKKQINIDLNCYFGSSLQINILIKKDLEKLPIELYNNEKIAHQLSEIFSFYDVKSNTEFFNSLLSDQPIAKTLTCKMILDNVRNIGKIIGFSEQHSNVHSLLEINHKHLIKINQTKSQILNFPQAMLVKNNFIIMDNIKRVDNHINYLNYVIDNFDIESMQSVENAYAVFLLYPYLKDKDRENILVIETAIKGFKNYKNLDSQNLYTDNFFHHMSIQSFKDNYTYIFKNFNDLPQLALACYLEIENALYDVLKKKPEDYTHRPFQDTKQWKIFCEKNNLSSILSNVEDYKIQYPGFFSLLSKVDKINQSGSSEYIIAFFKKFSEKYNPLANRIDGNNYLSIFFGEHIISNYPEIFEKNIKVNKNNALYYFELYQNIGSSIIKDKLISIIADIQWDSSLHDDIIIFKELIHKIGKKNVGLVAENINSHQMFKNSEILKYLATTNYFTNTAGAGDIILLPMEHIFSIQEVEELYKNDPERNFIKVSPFTFIPLAPIKYKTDSALWIDLINEKSKTSILQFMPISLKNNPEVLLKMIKLAPKKTESIISHFYPNAKNNISVFLQVLENFKTNSLINALQSYEHFIKVIMPDVDMKKIDCENLKKICEELLMQKVLPVNNSNSTRVKPLKF